MGSVVLWAVVFENCYLGGPRIQGGLGAPVAGPPRTPHFSIIFSMLFWHRFLVDLGSIFPPNLPPQTFQNPRKIDAKSLSILDFKFSSILAPNLDPPNLENSGCCSEKQWFFKNPLFANHIDFSPMLVPTCLRFPSQTPPHNLSQDTSIFWSIFG